MRPTPLFLVFVFLVLIGCGSIEPPPAWISAFDFYAPVVSVQIEFAGTRVLDASQPLCTALPFGRRVGFTLGFGTSDNFSLVEVEAEPSLMPRATHVTLTEFPSPEAVRDFQQAQRGFLHQRFLDECCPHTSGTSVLCGRWRPAGFSCAMPLGLDEATRAAMARVRRQTVRVEFDTPTDIPLADGPVRIVTHLTEDRVRCPGWLMAGLASR